MSQDNNQDQQDRIDRFLRGDMDDNERREFDEELSRDADLTFAFGETETALDAIELAEDRALKARLQALESSLGTHAATPPPASEVPAPAPAVEPTATVRSLKPLQRSRWTLLAYAASLLLLLSAAWFVLRPSGPEPGQLAMDYFEPYPNLAYSLQRGDDGSDPRAAAYLAYESGDYATAVRLLSELPESGARAFYLGQSYLALEEFAAAEEQFIDAQVPDFNLHDEARYYMALAQIGQGKLMEATMPLHTVISNSEADDQLVARARELLEELE